MDIVLGSIIHKTIYVLSCIFNLFRKNNKVEPFDKEDNHQIEILETNKSIDEKNVQNYLNHHILYTDDKFHETHFTEEPLIVKFKYNNQIYQISLNKLESKKEDHLPIVKQPKILSAVVKKDNDEYCVTEKISQFHGNTRNFFSHIPDVKNDFSIIIKDNDGKLYIFDMMGNHKVHTI
jgi:hypothetical protein